MSPVAQFRQKTVTLITKAALSSVPLASLVFDVGQAAIDFGNARQAARLLKGLSDRIEGMEEGARARLAADEIYQASAQAAIRRMMTENNPRMADALARAVATLGASDLPLTERAEIARALDALTEPSLHLLQTHYRAQADAITDREIEAAEGPPTSDLHLTVLLYATMPLSSWIAPTSDLQQAGLIQTILSGGSVEDDAALGPSRLAVSSCGVLDLGERVLHLCFDDPTQPAFGAFAVEG